jgi:hypothetical protein
MARLSILLGLIVIVSVFLWAVELSAVSANPTQAVQQSSPLASRNPTPTLTGPAGGDAQNGSWTTLLTLLCLIVSAVATALLAGFNWRLVGVTDEMRKATSEAAEAARQSANAASNQLEFTKVANAQNIEIATQAAEAAKRNVEIAKLGLKTDRPYLIVEECRLEGMPETGPVPIKTGPAISDLSPLAGVIWFTNFGKGAAIIDEVIGHLVLVPKLPVPKDFFGCQAMAMPKAAIRSNEQVKGLSPMLDMFAFKTQEECDAVMQGTLKLIFYGCIRYSDVFEETYETGFLWTYSPPTKPPWSFGGFVQKGPAAHNYRT